MGLFQTLTASNSMSCTRSHELLITADNRHMPLPLSLFYSTFLVPNFTFDELKLIFLIAFNLLLPKTRRTSTMKHTQMASLLSLFAISILLLALIHGGFGVEASKQFKVGDDFGWQEPSMNNTGIYSHWASSHRFRVGDSLCEFVFVYFTF